MRKLCLLILSLIVLTSVFTACGKSTDNLSGEWTFSLDIGPALSESFSTMEEFSHINFDNINIKFVMKISDGGEYSFHIDEESSRAAVDTLIERIVESLPAFRAEQAAEYGITVEELTKDDMTDEEFEAKLKESYSGKSLSDLSDINIEFDGFCTVSEDVIYLYSSRDDISGGNSYGKVRYSVSGNSLTVNSFPGSGSLNTENMFPMVFTKQ